MLISLKTCVLAGVLIAGAMLTVPARAADQRPGGRGNPQPQGQPVSRQDAFFGQASSRQSAFFSQPVFPQQPFNQNATILPPAYYAPMQLNYQGAPAGIIPGTNASFNPVLINTGSGSKPGFSNSRGIATPDAGSTPRTFVGPVTPVPDSQRAPSFVSGQTVTQIMPRMGLLGRW